jgi:CYTH domain-containing protein/predicted ATPase
MIKKVVLTGGPCSGKTTILPILKERFEELGWRVLVAPEAPTILLSTGFACDRSNDKQSYDFQTSLIHLQWTLEEAMDKAARHTTQRTLIIYDRGLMDGQAFCSRQVWDKIVYNNNLSEIKNHYDLVVFLESAATNAKESYTTSNNKARKETVEEAAALDSKIAGAWIYHRHFKYVKCQRFFCDKTEEVFQHIFNAVNDQPIELERKFLVDGRAILPQILQFPHCVSKITQYYINGLEHEIGEVRVRQRITKDFTEYTQTCKKDTNYGRIEIETPYSRFEFLKNIGLAKTRYTFLYKGTVFELDAFTEANIEDDFYLLEVEVLDLKQEIEFPPFLKVMKEVTENPAYYNKNLAKNRIFV